MRRALTPPKAVLLGLVAQLLLAAPGRAEPPADRPESEPPLALLPTPPDALIDPSMARSWATLPPRPFVAATVDAGFVYVRPRVSVGYGRPFTSWFGVDANPIASKSLLGAYAGLRFELPFANLRIGPRYISAFRHTFLPDRPSYSRLDLESAGGDKARFLTWEAELDLALPLGPGAVLGRASVSYVTGVPEGQAVFEETLHAIVKPPLVWRARGGYAFPLGRFTQHSIAFVVDVLDVPKRDDSVTVRAGPLLCLVLSRRAEIRGSFVATVVSPDSIGLAGGDFTELGVRYRWASE